MLGSIQKTSQWQQQQLEKLFKQTINHLCNEWARLTNMAAFLEHQTQDMMQGHKHKAQVKPEKARLRIWWTVNGDVWQLSARQWGAPGFLPQKTIPDKCVEEEHVTPTEAHTKFY